MEEIRPKTFADFEKVMATDLDFKSFITSSIELENLRRPESSSSILQHNSAKIKKTLSASELEELKKIKNFDEMRNYLLLHQFENSEKIVSILERQSRSFFQFVKNYPEYKKLNIIEKKLLISNAFKSYDKLVKYIQFNGSLSHDKLMVAEDPAQTYGRAIQACQDNYRILFDTIWASADLIMTGTSFETAGIGTGLTFIGACVSTYFADLGRGVCMDLAAENYYGQVL